MIFWVVIVCVLLINVKFFLVWRFKGCLFNFFNILLLFFFFFLYNIFFLLINVNVKCDNGVKFFDVLREFCCGIIGIICLFIKNCNCFINFKVVFEWFFNNVFNCKIIMINVIFFENGLFSL